MFLTPRIALVFKKLFGVEENKDLLISLINSVVSEEDKVVEITLLNPYNFQNFQTDKLSILDIKAKNQDGKRFNIEIQISDDLHYDKRILYYWSKVYAEQMQQGFPYSQLTKTIAIHILNFEIIAAAENYHNVFHIMENKSKNKYFHDFEIHTLELTKFTSDSDELKDIIGKVKNSLDRWLAFLSRNDLLSKDNLPEELDDIHIKKALEVMEIMSFNETERVAYEDHLKWFRDKYSVIESAKEEGLMEGIAEGFKKGIEKGEKDKTIQVAKEMLADNENL
ncbi:hypothetical protein RAS_02570 [Rickettsia asiatica]|uniref:Transposase n=1 Tax=Rickettsia asiatica TaxID=238800 RepID=A0A510G6H5_9RICK|nr:Rpn family recombination-promoting nuclease/putative transposase [Rickettsia asiatica]BBJ31148.1 hypothetical protein RAS_02570 [Rickettsia asiatica]